MNQIVETRAQSLFPDVDLGSRLLSELLVHMRRVLEGRQIGDMELCHLWTKCMPEKMRPGLGICT
uniref:Transcriptional regulator n=1 Tax=Mesocestoides corti TaxID=53468 RepID=A0A5K3FRD6_MESCO